MRLDVVDAVEDLFEAGAVELDLEFGVDLLEDLLLVGLIEDGEALGIEQPSDILAEDTDAEAVVGGDERGIVSVADEGTDAALHFAGGFIGEGHAEDVAGMDAGGFDEVGIPVREGFGFAGTGAGDDADVAFGCGDRFDLLFVQFIKQVHHNRIILRISPDFAFI